MTRRDFAGLVLGGATTLAAQVPEHTEGSLVHTRIDTHTHFYDPSRPQGVPWPPRTERQLYRTVLPPDFVRVSQPYGITGTVVVEASPLVEDNDWILKLAARHPVIVGFVGNLVPGTSDFDHHFDALQRNRLFRGIRIGMLWDRDLAQQLQQPGYVSGLKTLAQADLCVDAVGGVSLLEAVLRVSDAVPALRIVIDHLPYDLKPDERPAYSRALSELSKRPRVYAKVSNVPRKNGARVSASLSDYRESLDELWSIFGAERVIYGSNWPVSERVAPYGVAFNLVHEYFSTRGPEVEERFFWRNAKLAYRWVDRRGLSPTTA